MCDIVDPVNKGFSISMQQIPGGRILLRDEGSKQEWYEDVQAFEIGTYQLSHEQYAAIVSPSDRPSVDGQLPVTELSWMDAIEFCNRLSTYCGLDVCYQLGKEPDGSDVFCDFSAKGYRLPSEAEWELACRAGSNEHRYGELDEIAWYRKNSDGEAHPVGLKRPNAWGLYDMIGNVWEWCWNLYDPNRYGAYRVFRGGGWSDLPHSCRASCRRKSHPTFKIDDLGVRLARSR